MEIKKFQKSIIIIVAVVVGISFFARRTRVLTFLKSDNEKPEVSQEASLQKNKFNEGETKVSIFAKGLGKPRLMAWSPSGDLVTSITKQGRVVVLEDKDGDGVSESTRDIITGLQLPHGIAFYNNDLYIAETHRVIALRNIKEDYTYDKQETVLDGIPGGQNHFSRTLLIRDDKLFVSVGSSCNVCNESHEWRAAIIEANIDGSNARVYAGGLRNAVGITFHPKTGELWATGNGRDLLGANTPPDEINIIQKGKNYGWPMCYGKQIHDTDFDKNVYIKNPCEDTEPSVFELQAHVAPLGLRFYEGEMFNEFSNDLFVALHGSWNRIIPVGYQISRLEMKDGKIISEHNFIDSSSLPNKPKKFRPVDIIFDSEGKIYISDDENGIVYVVSK